MPLVATFRTDWFRVITDLTRKNLTTQQIADELGVSKSAVLGWKSGSEPRHGHGEALIALWCLATSSDRKKLPTVLQLAERNAILATLNAQGAAIVARFEEYAFTDSLDHPLTNNLDFLNLVRKATDVSTGGTAEQVTNEEGKKQPVRSAPVLTEHGWHVPG